MTGASVPRRARPWAYCGGRPGDGVDRFVEAPFPRLADSAAFRASWAHRPAARAVIVRALVDLGAARRSRRRQCELAAEVGD